MNITHTLRLAALSLAAAASLPMTAQAAGPARSTYQCMAAAMQVSKFTSGERQVAAIPRVDDAAKPSLQPTLNDVLACDGHLLLLHSSDHTRIRSRDPYEGAGKQPRTRSNTHGAIAGLRRGASCSES